MVRVWDLDKKTEEAAHKYMRGGTLKRKAHNEFYIEGENYERMVKLLDNDGDVNGTRQMVWSKVQENMIDDFKMFRPPMAIPPVRYVKEKVCKQCGAKPLWCQACQQEVRKKEWGRHIKTQKHIGKYSEADTEAATATVPPTVPPTALQEVFEACAARAEMLNQRAARGEMPPTEDETWDWLLSLG